MLHELYISDLALIGKARVQFGRGLNILTGETGAGKTAVIGAINLLLGGRADASLIRRGSTKAEVQGLFSAPSSLRNELDELSELVGDIDELIIRRVISTDGKNKCYINDRLVTAGTLAETGKRLVDLHGQHEHQSLFRVTSHIDFLDRYGGEGLLSLRLEFAEKSKELRRLKQELAGLKGAERELLRKKDLLKFQLNEIDKAGLASSEDEELYKEREILRNAERLFSSVNRATNLLVDGGGAAGATELLAQAVDGLRSVAGVDPNLDELVERLNSILLDTEDCASSLRDYGMQPDFPPGRLQEVEDRLALISLLKKKYGSTIDEILEYRDKALGELKSCDLSGERAEIVEADILHVERILASVAAKLSTARREVGQKFANEVEKELADLNMPNTTFGVSISHERDADGLLVDGEPCKIYPHGIDKVEFLISPNKGEPAMPLVKIASGGEISRVMLALKIALADADRVPVLVFDEIDVGIGGKTAMAVGRKMSVLSKKHQVMAVTHLPQIASFADKHFSITKTELEDRSVTVISELLNENRVNEMARLLSGNMNSDVSLRHAEELIVEAQKAKMS